jgi:NRPS condensation-like uncharacterized protein
LTVSTDLPATGYRPSQSRFALVDELTCYYDRPAEPTNVHMEARVADRLDVPAMRAAVRAVLDAEPGLRARQKWTSRWQSGFYWEYRDAPDIDPVQTASFADENELDRLRSALLSQSPPLHVSPPLRFLIASGPGGDALILNAHHSRIDGLSCLRLFRMVAGEYTRLVGSPPAPSARDGAWTEERREEGRRHPEARRQAGGSGGSSPRDKSSPRVNTASTTKIAREPEAGPPVARHGYGVRQFTWDGLADAAWLRSAGISVNDLLIGALIITIGDWNAAHGRKPGLIKITMPVGDRAQAGADGVWANNSRLTSVTARVGRNSAVLELLADVAAQTRYAKEHNGPQVDFFSRTLAAAPIPVGIKDRLLRTALGLGGSFLCDTCLVSNLGIVEPVRFGPTDASHLWFSTFAHMPRGLSLGALTTAGALHLTFRYRRALLSDHAAADFAGRYAEALGRLASREGTS